MVNLVQNGDFEGGTLTGWTFEQGKVYLSLWSGRQYDFVNPTNPPMPRIVTSATPFPELNQPMTPFEGNNMLQINDLEGGNDVTICYQDVTLPADLPLECTSLKVKWAAILLGSDHKKKERPLFVVEIQRWKNNKWKKFKKIKHSAPKKAKDGWIDIASPDESESHWYKSGDESYSLTGLDRGDKLRIKFTADDCTLGAHGGTVFIDAVEIFNGCDGKAGLPITVDPIPNVFSPNGDGINDIWGLSNLENACHIEFEVHNRWGRKVFHFKESSPDGTWPPFLPIWDGTIIPSNSGCLGCGGQTERMILPDDMNEGTVFFILKLENCHEVRDETGNIAIFL